MAPAGWEEDEEEEGGSETWSPSLFVFFMLRSKVPFSSTSMSDSCRVQTQTLDTAQHRERGKRRRTLGQGSLDALQRLSGRSQQRVDRLRMAVAAMWAASASWL